MMLGINLSPLSIGNPQKMGPCKPLPGLGVDAFPSPDSPLEIMAFHLGGKPLASA